MRRQMIHLLIVTTAILGTLSLSGCIVEPARGYHREHVVVHERDGGHHGDRDRDRDRDHDRDRDRGHDHDDGSYGH